MRLCMMYLLPAVLSLSVAMPLCALEAPARSTTTVEDGDPAPAKSQKTVRTAPTKKKGAKAAPSRKNGKTPVVKSQKSGKTGKATQAKGQKSGKAAQAKGQRGGKATLAKSQKGGKTATAKDRGSPVVAASARDSEPADDRGPVPSRPAPEFRSMDSRESPRPADEPEVLDAQESAPYIARLRPLLARVFEAAPGGKVDVEFGEAAQGTVEGRPIVAFESIRVSCGKGKIQGVEVSSSDVEVTGLALDRTALRIGRVAIVGKPVVRPNLVIDRQLVLGKLQKMKVKDPSVSFEGSSMVLAGRVSALLFSVPFQVRGRLSLVDDNVGYVVDELTIRGHRAGPERVAQVQGQTKKLIGLERTLEPLGLARVDVRGGQLNVRSGEQLVYTGSLDRPNMAE